jgi:hypothetical protein
MYVCICYYWCINNVQPVTMTLFYEELFFTQYVYRQTFRKSCILRCNLCFALEAKPVCKIASKHFILCIKRGFSYVDVVKWAEEMVIERGLVLRLSSPIVFP